MDDQDKSLIDRGVLAAGGDPKNLGCVMLNVKIGEHLKAGMDPEWAYYDEDQEYVRGFEGRAHITLLYGLLFSAKKEQSLIDEVLKDWWMPERVSLPAVSYFNQGEYSALVLKPAKDSDTYQDLYDANVLLSSMPHVRTYFEYQPHLTIGYVHNKYLSIAYEVLRDNVMGGKWHTMPNWMETDGLDYGD